MARRARATGFTLLEIMIVVFIVGLLATLVTPRLMGRTDEARRAKATADLATFAQALDLYRLDSGAYPTTPQGLAALVALWRWRAAPSASPSPVTAGTRAGAWFAAAVVLLYVGAFSLSDRRADRYIFPAYYAVGAAGGIAALRLAPRLRRLAERLDRPWLPAAAWAVLFAAHLFAGRLGLPTVKLWAP